MSPNRIKGGRGWTIFRHKVKPKKDRGGSHFVGGGGHISPIIYSEHTLGDNHKTHIEPSIRGHNHKCRIIRTWLHTTIPGVAEGNYHLPTAK